MENSSLVALIRLASSIERSFGRPTIAISPSPKPMYDRRNLGTRRSPLVNIVDLADHKVLSHRLTGS